MHHKFLAITSLCLLENIFICDLYLCSGPLSFMACKTDLASEWAGHQGLGCHLVVEITITLIKKMCGCVRFVCNSRHNRSHCWTDTKPICDRNYKIKKAESERHLFSHNKTTQTLNVFVLLWCIPGRWSRSQFLPVTWSALQLLWRAAGSTWYHLHIHLLCAHPDRYHLPTDNTKSYMYAIGIDKTTSVAQKFSQAIDIKNVQLNHSVVILSFWKKYDNFSDVQPFVGTQKSLKRRPSLAQCTHTARGLFMVRSCSAFKQVELMLTSSSCEVS